MQIHRILLAAASAVLLLFQAAPAHALSNFSKFKCENPSEADDIMRDYFVIFPTVTVNLDANGCEKFCKDLEKICVKNVSAFQKCMKNDDKLWFKLRSKLCSANFSDKQGVENCRSNVKEAQRECKEELARVTDMGKAECEEWFGPDGNGFCQDNCEDGSFD